MNEQSQQENDERIEQLTSVIAGLEQTSRMLVRRDIDLRRAYEQLKSLDLEKTEFVSIAAHQLRTPVTTARWAVQYLLSDAPQNLNEKQLKLLERASNSIEHIYELVEELLELNRVDFGGIEIALTPGSVEKLCTDVINDHKPAIDRRGLKVTKHFPERSRTVNFDTARFRDAVDNLIDNAIKYTEPGGSIEISVRYDNGMASISVKDTGIGVEKGHEKQIFNKFTRLGNAEQIDPNGIGIGLYISRKIAEKHCGELIYEHNEPKGSIFTISIPC